LDKKETVDDFILIKSGNKHHKVKIDDIIFIESLKDYIKVHTVNEKQIISKYKISEIGDELVDKKFLRVHRSYIINTTKISAFSVNEIEVGNSEIPIGASYKQRVVSFLDTINKR